MKTFRRIEITAFRRRVTVLSGRPTTVNTAGRTYETGVCLNNADTGEPIEMGSEEGQRILYEAMRLLEENLGHTN